MSAGPAVASAAADPIRPPVTLQRAQRSRRFARWTLPLLLASCAFLVVMSMWTLARDGDLSLGRRPWQNLHRTAPHRTGRAKLPARLVRGNLQLEVRDGTGLLLRMEDQRATERRCLDGLSWALWTTLRIATLGIALAALLALPLGLLAARNLQASRVIGWGNKGVLDVLRAIHTLVFGLFLVGMVGLGATAGILAVALHWAGTLGKLLAESIEPLDMRPVDAVRATGARQAQVFS